MMRRRIGAAGRIALAVILASCTCFVHAETSGVSATGFVVTHRFETTVTAHDVFDALHKPALWWSSDHTWSGDARNLRLQPAAGGCFCERWGANSVKHGEVIFVMPDSLLRLRASLGPLQALAVDGILSFAVKRDANRTTVTVTYRVAGNPEAQLASIAEPVDRVIGEQVSRLARYVEKGRPG
jgi:uncharacterized protein YndB with AHSA1/START domain